jgi:hypothetical protein
MSLKIMKGAITEGILGAIPDSIDAKKYMASIEEKYRGNDKQYSLSIMHKLINTKHHISKSIRKHIMYLCDLGAKLNTFKMGFDDPFMVHLALVSLPDEYGNLVSSYNNIKEKWTIDELISHAMLEEERLKKRNKDHINNIGNKRKFHVKGDNNNVKKNKPQSTYSKYEKGESFRSAQSKKDGEVCHFCGDDTHYKNDCAKWLKWLAHKGEDYITFVDESLYVNFSLNTWWIDSGATVHVCNSLKGFVMKTSTRKGEQSLKVADGKEAYVEAVGSIVLHLHSGFTLHLNNVLYVPSLKRNLILVRLLDIDSFSCNFGEMKCLIKYNDEDVGLAYLQDKLYLLSLNESVMNVCDDKDKRFSKNETSSKLWHSRLGHISRGRIERLIKEEILHLLDFSNFDQCIECIKGKFVKQIKKGAVRSTGILELIHMNICDPFPIESVDGFDSFKTFTDDYSRYGYIYPIKHRSELLDKFKIFKAEFENQHNLKIKVVRSKRRGEYYGKHVTYGQILGPFARYLQENGIVTQYSMLGEPQQNVVAER